MSKQSSVGLLLLCIACNAPGAPRDGAVALDAPGSWMAPDARAADDAAAGLDASRPADAGGLVEDASTPRDASAATPDASTTRDASARRDAGRDASTTRDAGAPRDAGHDAGPRTTLGCGVSAGGDGAWATRTLRVGGADRVYRVFVPATYDHTRAYPVVFRWHGWGGDGLSGGLGIEYASGEDAIVVSGDAIGAAWDLTPGGSDVAYFDALLDRVGRDYCVDRDRVFSYGFSRGGGMTNLLACERADVIRASAAVAGMAAWSATCTRPIATWLLHDGDDDAVPVGDSIAMRDRFLAANGCAAATTPVSPSPCVRYDGCAAGDPVVYCQTSGYGHDIRGDFAPGAVWSFFSSLPR